MPSMQGQITNQIMWHHNASTQEVGFFVSQKKN